MIRLLHSDNLPILRSLVREGVAVDLAVLDPPFMTNRVHRMKDGAVAFDDRWTSLTTYVDHLARRLEIVYTLLAPHGSMVVHLDPRTVHHVKVRCDAMFGRERFAGQIVWRYRRWPTPTQNLQSMHDVLLRYVRDPNVAPRFHQLYEPNAPSTLKTWKNRRQLALFDEARGTPGRRRTRSSMTSEASPGAPLSDVWDISVIAPMSKERTSFPTQKPLALLRRIVSVFSDEGDLVLDPYCGSGTTLEAARLLGRRAIGIDASDAAVRIAEKRLNIEAEVLGSAEAIGYARSS